METTERPKHWHNVYYETDGERQYLRFVNRVNEDTEVVLIARADGIVEWKWPLHDLEAPFAIMILPMCNLVEMLLEVMAIGRKYFNPEWGNDLPGMFVLDSLRVDEEVRGD